MSTLQLLLRPSPATAFLPKPPRSSPVVHQRELFYGNYLTCHRGLAFVPFICNAVPNALATEGVLQSHLSIEQLDSDKQEREEAPSEASYLEEIRCRICFVREMLNSIGDGQISVSAYDTAWVALVEDMQGGGKPQFPSSLQWVVENQLTDGSWGDRHVFSAHDRIINTLACVIALRSWNIFPDKCEKGMSFLREHMAKLDDYETEHMPIGFEVAFPSLIEKAQALGLKLQYNSPVLKDIYEKRRIKLSRIPRAVLHDVPTTLLHSLEGMTNLEWDKLLKLQSYDGSFLFSPSSTAFAFLHTKDRKCLEYISRTVQRFNGGVPNVYPVDMFERIWVVDRLERLGISRHFELEIRSCMDYTYSYWTDEGICWARNSRVRDVDDTAMGFRLLRLHGYQVSAGVFCHFEKDGEFLCFAGQSSQAITGMFNLYRATQVMFPGEKILQQARAFSGEFLREKQAAKQLLDKWIITKDLPGEVGYALDFPFFASLPRVETRFYMEQYGGEADVWIGKTLYRMPYVSNEMYLELAKLDFNRCQALHQWEWLAIQDWVDEWNFGEHGITGSAALMAYFVAAASIFEPDKATERLAWARTNILLDAISTHLETGASESRQEFVRDFLNQRFTSERTAKKLVGALFQTVQHLSWEVMFAHGVDIRRHLRDAWAEWLMRWERTRPTEAEFVVRCINLCAGRPATGEVLLHPEYLRLASLTDGICYQSRLMRLSKINNWQTGTRDDVTASACTSIIQQMDHHMQTILQSVLQTSDGINPDIKRPFFAVARSYYYRAYCPSSVSSMHIAKVLYEKIV